MQLKAKSKAEAKGVQGQRRHQGCSRPKPRPRSFEVKSKAKVVRRPPLSRPRPRPDILSWRCLGGRLTEWWGAGVVICLERGADLHTAQLMPLPLTVSCFSKIQIGFTFLVPAHLGSLGQRAVKRVCVCVSRRSRTIHVVRSLPSTLSIYRLAQRWVRLTTGVEVVV